MPEESINLIRRSPYQPRLYFERDDLKRSMELDGMLVSILVREKPDENTKYEIIDGERRWLAAQDLGWEKVPIELRNVEDEIARRMVYTLNEERQPYNAEENTKFFRRMYEQMGSVYQVAQAFQRPQSVIWDYINISILPEHLQKAVWARRIKIGEIQELEPLFTEARDEIGDITSSTKYEASPTYQRIVAICEGIYKEEIKGREEVRDYSDAYLEQLDKARRDRAKEEVEKAAPTDLGEAIVRMETSEDYVRAAELLMKEAQRRKTPEQKAEEERKKLIAEARKSLNSVANKIDRASKVMDVTEFRDRLDKIRQSLDKNPGEAKTQLATLGQEIKEAEEKAKVEAKAKAEEEKRQKQAEEEKRRQQRAIEIVRRQYLEDVNRLREVLEKAPKELVEEIVFTEEEREILRKPKKPTTIMDTFYELEKQAKKLSEGLAELTEFPPMGKTLLGVALRDLQTRIDETLSRMGLQVMEGEAKLIKED